jgi:hypothetical protein
VTAVKQVFPLAQILRSKLTGPCLELEEYVLFKLVVVLFAEISSVSHQGGQQAMVGLSASSEPQYFPTIPERSLDALNLRADPERS